jgi:hypothetical protein
MNKILLALQFWQGDKDAAIKLAHYLASLEPKHCEIADFLLVQRFDTVVSDEDRKVLDTLSRKFNLYAYRSRRKGTGWPNGCNDLWRSTMEWTASMILARKVPHYKAIFCFEADGGPIFRDWVARLSQAWDDANAKGPVVQAGPMVSGPGINLHINGNCMLSCDKKFLDFLTRRIGEIPVWGGWDYLYAGEFQKRGWANVPGMRSYYNSPHFSIEQYRKMREENLIWVHGDKSNDLIELGKLYMDVPIL